MRSSLAIVVVGATLLFDFVASALREGLLPYGKAVREAYFQFAPGTIYFNHGGYGATPRPVREALDKHTSQMEAQPTDWFGKFEYQRQLANVRPRLARLVGADESDLVFLDNASGGMNAVLRSLAWRPGDILLMTNAAYAVFPNTASFLQKQYGIRVVTVSFKYPVEGPQAYIAPLRSALADLGADRDRVRLALFDHISSYPSVVLPAAELAAIVKEETRGNALVFLDGAHALGHVNINLREFQAAGIDFYVADGHKWLFSPKGSAFLWAAPAAQDLLQPDVISSENAPGTPFQERFDYIGTRDYGPWLAMADALDFREHALGGEDRILAYLHELAAWGGELLADRFGTHLVAPMNMTAGLLTVGLPVPTSLSPEDQSSCALMIKEELLARHQMQIIPFTITGASGLQHVARISAQVYLERQDFEDLAANTLAITSECGSAKAAGSSFLL